MDGVNWGKRARELINWSEDVEQALQLGREMAAEARMQAQRDAASYWLKDTIMAADERAEEIAKALEIWEDTREWPNKINVGDSVFATSADLARSFISKPEMPELVVTANDQSKQRYADALASACKPLMPSIIAAVETQEAIRADEREKIARMLPDLTHNWPELSGDREQYALLRGAEFLRRMNKPKTREAVLEEALKEIADSTNRDNIYGDQKRLTAKRALEWRPDK